MSAGLNLQSDFLTSTGTSVTMGVPETSLKGIYNMKKTIGYLVSFYLLFSMTICANAVATPTLTLESKSAVPGQTIKLSLTLSNQGGEIAGVGTDITFDASMFEAITSSNLSGVVEIGPAATAADKTISKNILLNGTKLKIGIFSSNNNNLINDGIVAYVNLTVRSTATGSTSLVNAAQGSTSLGEDIPVTGNTAQISFSGVIPEPELPQSVNTYMILTDTSVPLTIPSGAYVQVTGSAGANTINVKSGARVECQNFVGPNVVNIEEGTFVFMVSRSGATVTLESTDGTRIQIAAKSTAQTLRFANGSSSFIISADQVKIGTQVITATESQLDLPVNSGDTSENMFCTVP